MLVIAMVAVLVTAAAASAAPRKIVPAGPDPAWGCVQETPPSLQVRGPRGALITPTFAQAGARLAGQVRVLTRRLRKASGAKRRRLHAQRRRLVATMTGVRRCRAGSLAAPARSRRSFAFVCLHGFLLPSVIVEGSCAVDLRPRGVPSGRARAAAYDIGKTYDTLDVVLGAECAEDRGAFEGPERMQDVYGLYLVRCGSEPSEEPTARPAGVGRPAHGGRELRRDPRGRRERLRPVGPAAGVRSRLVAALTADRAAT